MFDADLNMFCQMQKKITSNDTLKIDMTKTVTALTGPPLEFLVTTNCGTWQLSYFWS